MLVRIANREDPDQLCCLFRPFWQSTSVRNFRTFTAVHINFQFADTQKNAKQVNIDRPLASGKYFQPCLEKSCLGCKCTKKNMYRSTYAWCSLSNSFHLHRLRFMGKNLVIRNKETQMPHFIWASSGENLSSGFPSK